MKKLYFYLLFLLPALGAAQPAISLKNAIDTTLANSFEIKIAKNTVAYSTVNNSFGVAGGLPTLNASVTDNESVTNVNQQLNTGATIAKSSGTKTAKASSLVIERQVINL